MRKHPSHSSPPNPGAALARLILACKEDMIAHSEVARHLRDVSDRAHVVEETRERGRFVVELRSDIDRIGGPPLDRTSARERLRQALRRARQSLENATEKQAYGLCARSTAAVEASYERAMLAPLPDKARFDVQQQYATIIAERVEMDQRAGARG